MIKAEAKVIGTVRRRAEIRTDKNNNPFVSFIMITYVKDDMLGQKGIDIFVSKPGGQQMDLSALTEGSRVAVSGSMDIRKKSNALAFYMTAETISVDNVTGLDAIAGTMHFRGSLKKENVCEEKTDKKGRPFLIFSGYSSEKVGDDFVSVWVNFMRFTDKDASAESLKPSWMRPKARISVSGDLQVSAYNGAVKLGCRVKEMSEYVPEQRQ